MFNNPSIAQQLANTLRQIVLDTERVRVNVGKINRGLVTATNAMQQLVQQSQLIANNLSAAAGAVGQASTGAQNLQTSMGQSAAASVTAAGATNQVNNNLNKANKQAQTLSQLGKSIVSQFNLLGKTVLIASALLVKLGIDAAREFQKAGFAFSQVVTGTITSIGDVFNQLSDGVISSAADNARARVALSRELGTLSSVNKTLTGTAVELSNVYEVAESKATKLVGQLFRWTGRSDALAKSSLQFVQALAKANNTSFGNLVEQIAENTDEFARNTAMGAENFAKQLITLNKMGISMKSISSFADRLVSDFDGSLQAAAKIQTFLPGFNLAGAQIASQFGSNEQVAVELKTALQATGLKSLSDLPRSLQNSLSQSLNMSFTELENLLTGQKSDEALNPPTKKDLDSWGEKFANSFISQTAALIGALTTLNAFTAFVIGQNANKIVAAVLGKNIPTGVGGKLGGKLKGLGGVLKSPAGRLASTVGLGAVIAGVGSAVSGGGLGGSAGAAGGFVVGAKLGATAGTAIAPGIGTAIGAMIGGSLFSIIGEDMGRRLTPAIENLRQRLFGASDAQKMQTDAVNSSTSAISREEQLRRAAAQSNVKNFDFAMAMNNSIAGENQSWLSRFFGGIFHNGGVVGSSMMVGASPFNANEMFAILERGEMVLNKNQIQSLGSIMSMAMTPNKTSVTTLPVDMDNTLLQTISKLNTSNTNTPSSVSTTSDVKVLERKFDELIGLMRGGGVAVYLDGKKVSSTLIDVNRYG